MMGIQNIKWECSATIIITKDNKILFQHRDEKKNIVFPGYISLIAGKVEQGELPEVAASREISEEIEDITKCEVEFTKPLHLFSFITNENVLEHIFIAGVFQNENKLRIREGQGFKVYNELRIPMKGLIAPHHEKAIYIFVNQFDKLYKIRGGTTMDLKDYFQVSSLGLKKDYSTMVSTGGFVDHLTGPIASIIPQEPARYIALLEFKSNIERGNHYHHKKVEYMVVLEGKLKCELKLIDNPEKVEIVTLDRGQCITILPECIHTYTALFGDAVTIEYSPQAYEKDDTVVLD